MEPKVIIQILEKAKVFTADKDLYKGLCHTISYACEDYNINYELIVDIIPEFTRENAKLHANARTIKSAYWWEVSDTDNRIKFLNWLIETYKNKL